MIIITCLLAPLGCAVAAQPPSPDDVAAAIPSGHAAAEEAPAERFVVGDPRRGGPVFQGTPTLPSPLQGVRQ